jgi:hypothetical protein
MYYSADKEDEQLTADHPEATPDFLDTDSQNGIPKHELHLKDMLCISEQMHPSFQKGLVNNPRLIAQHSHRHYVEVRVINNRTDQLGDVQCIPRIRFEFTRPHASCTIHGLQFTLQPAYATTGCQGLTGQNCSTCAAMSSYTVSSTQHFPVSACRGLTHPFSDDNNDYDYNTSNVVYVKELY